MALILLLLVLFILGTVSTSILRRVRTSPFSETGEKAERFRFFVGYKWAGGVALLFNAFLFFTTVAVVIYGVKWGFSLSIPIVAGLAVLWSFAGWIWIGDRMPGTQQQRLIGALIGSLPYWGVLVYSLVQSKPMFMIATTASAALLSVAFLAWPRKYQGLTYEREQSGLRPPVKGQKRKKKRN